MQITTLPRPELIQIADTLARERNIERDAILEAMEQGISKAGRSKYGPEYDIRTQIDRKTGAIFMARYMTVVEHVENEGTELTLERARRYKKDAKIGDEIIDPLPPMDFGRIAAQTAKQVISSRVKEAERLAQYNEMKDRKGEIVSGSVRRVEGGNLYVDIGHVEALLRRDELIPRETYRVGDRIRALILDVRSEIKGPQVFLSRSHPQFLAKLFTAEVPEIYDGSIEIKAVARDPGSRAKIAVWAKDNTVDARGACIGMKGLRIQSVTAELQGEKIDVVLWSSDPATFIANALAPNDIQKIVIDEETKSIEVVLSEEQLSLAIGRRGQNIRLVSQLTGWHIDMMTEAQEAEHRTNITKGFVDLFMKALDIDDVMAHLLVQEGFTKVEEIALIPQEELEAIEGFDAELAEELQNRARAYVAATNDTLMEKIEQLNLSKDFKTFEGLTLAQRVRLGENGIKTLDDFADLSNDELKEILKELAPSEAEANNLIMKAREHWFDAEKQDA